MVASFETLMVITRTYITCSYSILWYDWIITLNRERRLIWRGPWSGVKVSCRGQTSASFPVCGKGGHCGSDPESLWDARLQTLYVLVRYWMLLFSIFSMVAGWAEVSFSTCQQLVHWLVSLPLIISSCISCGLTHVLNMTRPSFGSGRGSR